MGRGIFICSFSTDIADLKRGKRTDENMLAALSKNPRVSTFDMSEHQWLWKGLADMEKRGLIVSQEEPYPWHKYKLTDAGQALLRPNEQGQRP